MDVQEPKEKVIITAALTGALANREQCPGIPYTPVEIAEEAKRAYDAGATIVHIHAREDDGKPTWEPKVFAAIQAETEKRCPVVINFSTGGMEGDIKFRARHIAATQPHTAALNMGSMNYAIYSSKAKKFHMQAIFENPFHEIEWLLKEMKKNNVIPELECFDAGHICNADPFIDMGLLKAPIHFSIILGVTGGLSATEQNLKNQVGLLPEGSEWQLIGIGRKQWPLIATSLDIGGHIRVGLEDNLYLPSGEMAENNAVLVECAAKLVIDRGQSVATIDDTRKIIGLS